MDGSPNFFRNNVRDEEADGNDPFDPQYISDHPYTNNAPFDTDPDGSSIDAPLDQLSNALRMDLIRAQNSKVSSSTRPRYQLEMSSQMNPVMVGYPMSASRSPEIPGAHLSQHTVMLKNENADDDSNIVMMEVNGTQPPESSTTKKKKKKQRRWQAKEGTNKPEGEVVKRNKFLERNRVAATKCRQKKKEWVSDLEGTRFGLESQNNHLQMEYSSLKNEITQIKSQLMEHATCNDPNIDKWIENEAKRFVLGAGERYDRILTNIDPTTGLVHHQHQHYESTSSTSGYPTAPGSAEFVSPATPVHRDSISFPDPLMPNSPIFYRTGGMAPNMPSGSAGTSGLVEDTYSMDRIPTSLADDTTGLDSVTMAENSFQDSTIPGD
ncbi:uncharacterized protein GGS25DRAFT_522265 [Hypoxylon fragiforme]|uniref:uncharacterized protein n=1 Tax=Hypoxylon fragiforme TaxID=63214 RepID=UPI0020C669F0|nr:uncharacterized protein GGS25DRAFT_522265 [Hypoxylon fragiforme]KAI2609085.1 hypothetical protein GGS25DRAFT_522265 [Hypoxylon fragiforme]